MLIRTYNTNYQSVGCSGCKTLYLSNFSRVYTLAEPINKDFWYTMHTPDNELSESNFKLVHNWQFIKDR